MTRPDHTAADALVAEARRAVHESLILLPAWEADRVRSLLADLETAVEGRTAMRFAEPAVQAPADQAAEHACGNCEGIDPSTCLLNPDRPRTADRPTLRDRITEALLTTRRTDYADLNVKADHRNHRFDARCALCTYDVDALTDAVLAVLPEQPARDEAVADTLPAWLHQRFDPHGADWEQLDDDDRAYWEHHARAVRRAVARNGFKER